MEFKLVNISPLEVLADIEQKYATQAHATDPVTAQFNSSFHTVREAPDLPTVPSEEPYSFKRWLPLVLQSRGLAPSNAQVVTFSLAQARLLLRAADASIPSGHINRVYREDIDEEIVPAFGSLTFPPEGLFMRLEACSAKDGVLKAPGDPALRCVGDILLLLLTSSRARNALFHLLERGAEEFELFFTPWNARMRAEREYRVFCPPAGSADSLRISAISQYVWHKPWLLQSLSKEMQKQAAEKIVEGCHTIKRQIAGLMCSSTRSTAWSNWSS